MEIENKLKEKEKEYEDKANNLQSAQAMAMKLQTECINLEGQIKILKELKEDK